MVCLSLSISNNLLMFVSMSCPRFSVVVSGRTRDKCLYLTFLEVKVLSFLFLLTLLTEEQTHRNFHIMSTFSMSTFLSDRSLSLIEYPHEIFWVHFFSGR